MSSTNFEGISICTNESTSQSKSNDCEQFKRTDGDSPETIVDTDTASISKSKEKSVDPDTSENVVQDEESNLICSLENESSSDTQVEEIKLRWDDDEYPINIEQKNTAIKINEDSFVGLEESKPKQENLLITDNEENMWVQQAEQVICEPCPNKSQSVSFIDTTILAKKEHGINKPDVMLDIPGMLPDMDEDLESINAEIFSDSEKESNTEDIGKDLSELNLKVNTGITEILSTFEENELDSKLEMSSDNESNPEDTDNGVSELVLKVNTGLSEKLTPVDEPELDIKLEMSSDNDDDTIENTCITDKEKLAQAIENEMKIISDTMSSIEEEDYVETNPVNIPEVTSALTIDKVNLISKITNDVKSHAVTMSSIEQDDPMTNVLTLSEVSLRPLTSSEEENILEPQITPTEQRERDVNLKVSTIISNIEEEIHLLDSNDEMDILGITPSSNKSEATDLISSDTANDHMKEPKNKELNERELRKKEQEELALALKAIEPENEIHEVVPAVTLVNVNVADEISEISVIDEDDQPSISLVLDDDDESIEVLHHNSVSAIIDESEVSIIQDSEEDEVPILVPEADDISTKLNTPRSAKIHDIANKELEGISCISNEVINVECRELEASEIKIEEKCIILGENTIQFEQQAVKSEYVEPKITMDQTINDYKQNMLLDNSLKKENNNTKSEPLEKNRFLSDPDNKDTSGEIEKEEPDVALINSPISNKDESIKQNLKNVVNDKPLSSLDDTNDSKNVISQALQPEKDISGNELTENVSKQALVDYEPQPSTSMVDDLDMNKDSSNDVPDSDTLGLLAESTRVMDDDDDQDDDDDDDEDFYHDDESNLMMAEHSEDSNHQSEDAQEGQDEMETVEKHTTKLSELDSTDVSMVCDQDYSEQELDTPELQEEGFQFNITKVQKDGDNAEVMDTDGDESFSDIQLEAKTMNPSEQSKVDKEPEPKELEQSITEPALEKIENTSKPETATSVPAEKEKKSPNKMLSLTISSQQTVWNFVDLEESSEDEIQILPKSTDTSTTTKQPEPQPDRGQLSSQTQPEEELQVKQPMMSPATVTEREVEPDVDMNMEVLDEELLKGDEPKETTEDAAKTIPTVVQEEKPTTVTQKKPEPMAGLEVFNLDSDDEDTTEPTTEAPPSKPEQEPPKREFKCLNPSCQYTPGLRCYAADTATVAYYDGDKRRRLYVCEECLRPVQMRNEELMEGIRNCTPLLELEMATGSLDLVEISDSDSEGEPEGDEQEDTIGDVTAKFLKKNLAEMFNETWEKYQMETRLADTEAVLQMELRRLEIESKEINSFLDECQTTTDRIRNELYASFPQEIKQVPPLILYDTPDQQYCYVQASLRGKGGESNTRNSTSTRLAKRRLEAAAAATAENPAKRPAIPLGYTPLEAVEQVGKKALGKDADAMEKIDDDNTEVSVVNIISSEAAPPGLPPTGDLVKTPLRAGMMVYAMRNSFGSWVKGRILEVLPKGTSLTFTTCKVKFEHRNYKTPVKTVMARSMAYYEPASVRLTIGTRVIANFKDSKDNKEPSQKESKRESYFSGVVAEVPTPVNKYRYLIFFDDGYAQYASHTDIRLVCECASLVWEEVHPFSREFVREYLLAYPERPMVRLHPFQSLKTEWNGKWWASRVVAVDASLAQVHFPVNNRYEWIYRGSTRLAPLYLELQAAERHRARPMPRAQGLARANMPVVEYTRDDEQPAKSFDMDKTRRQTQEEDAINQRAVAKKSTGAAVAQPVPPARLPQGHNLDNVTSRVVYYTPKNAVKPHKMVPHTCGPKCKRTDVLALKDLRTYNPLAKPLLSGWERQIVRYKGQKAVVYRAPCGRRVRCARELHRYLRATRSDLPVDLFDFSPATHCLAEFVLNKCLIMKKDLSQGKENVPVPCVNYYDDTLPEFCLYNTERTPTAGVPLNLDPEFLCGCDCEDDCEDKSKCACWKLTLEGARTIGLEGDNVGYVYKRLPEPLPSGIYECNSRCKCKHTCLNRVAQHPLQLKLQIFKTLNRGWGIRALNDVPKGSFLCVYAGNLLTDATANLDGLNEGDEYLAELDYIEVVEQMKEGYEEDIPKELKKMTLEGNDDDDSEEDEESSEEESGETSKNELEDGDFTPAPHVGIRVTQFSKRLRQRNRNKENKETDEKKESEKECEKVKAKEDPKTEGERRGSNDEECITISDDDEVREPSSFAAAAGMGANAFVSKYRSVRSLYGEDESCYIMDAKVQGNIGRYLNHSCSPNVFVQNVFVDTHDPRFPWVAFFALSHVRAGTELTWNYNYDVGSVPGKALYCYCGAPNCRGRLL